MVDMERAARVVKTFKAQPITDELVQDAVIDISETTPDFSSLKDLRTVFLHKAQDIDAILYESLPGGVYDLLLGLMLRRKSTHFIVAHGEQDGGE